MLLSFVKGTTLLRVYIEQETIPEAWEADVWTKKQRSKHADAVYQIIKRNAQIYYAAEKNLEEEGYVRPRITDALRWS